MRTVPNISRNFKNVSSTIFVRRNQNLKTTIENYAYGYHSSATVIEGCTFGSNHYHVMYEFGSQDDNIFDSLYVPAVIPCLVNCFKLLIQPTQKDFVKRGAIISRLHVAVEYLSKSTSRLQLPRTRNNF